MHEIGSSSSAGTVGVAATVPTCAAAYLSRYLQPTAPTQLLCSVSADVCVCCTLLLLLIGTLMLD